MTTTAQAMRAYRGPAVLSGGFRPFFLLATSWGAVVVPIWVACLHLNGGLVGGVDGRTWHIHEMLFGFLAGIIAGFLLTAIPNWTGRLPVTGARLGWLVALWIAGRVASFAPPSVLASVVDSSFLIVFAAVVWREVLAGRNFRNLPVCMMLSLLALANILYHLAGLAPGAEVIAQRLAMAMGVGLISLIGGRIIPSFTQNWFSSQAIGPGPVSYNRFDRAVLFGTGISLALWVVWPYAVVAGVLLLACGVAHLVRLSRWRGWKAWREPLVWILHVGYLWLAVGLGLLGASVMAPAAVTSSAGVHAVTAGAVGVMTLAVMTRASLGHTGRAREADLPTLLIYLAVLGAAVVRVASPFAQGFSTPLLVLSAVLWSLAFGGFAVAYGPMLTRPRGR